MASVTTVKLRHGILQKYMVRSVLCDLFLSDVISWALSEVMNA